jgi:hypothetical protein
MAGRNFGLANIYLYLGLGMLLLGVAIFALGLMLGPRMGQFPWLANIARVLIPGGVVVYVIGRIAKAIAGLRSSPLAGDVTPTNAVSASRTKTAAE